MFATVLHNLKSPENTGIIVRTHVAFGGEKLVIVGPAPWRFRKRVQTFSRKLEKMTELIHLEDDDAFFDWCMQERFTPVAVEITELPSYLPSFKFPQRPAIIVGNECNGMPQEFLNRCSAVVTIPQFGPVECLNAAVSCCLAIYEFNRQRPVTRTISGDAFVVMNEEKR